MSRSGCPVTQVFQGVIQIIGKLLFLQIAMQHLRDAVFSTPLGKDVSGDYEYKKEITVSVSSSGAREA